MKVHFRHFNTQYRSLLSFLELEANPIKIQISPTTKELPDGFEWGPENEVDKCLTWLSSIVTIPEEKNLISVAHQPGLLNSDFGSYNVKGTIDLVFISELFVETWNIRGGIEITVELKKDIHQRYVKQAITQLITAATSSQFAVIVLLTDLKEVWLFSWLSKSGKYSTESTWV